MKYGAPTLLVLMSMMIIYGAYFPWSIAEKELSKYDYTFKFLIGYRYKVGFVGDHDYRYKSHSYLLFKRNILQSILITVSIDKNENIQIEEHLGIGFPILINFFLFALAIWWFWGRKTNIKKIFIFIIPLLLSGCISFYNTRNYKILAYETISKKPAKNYPIQVIYPYDHYGCLFLMFWNAPMSVETALNQNGQTLLKIANFYHPHIVVGSTSFELKKEDLIWGGAPFKFPYISDDNDYQRHKKIYNAYKWPFNRYPEVEIEITPQD